MISLKEGDKAPLFSGIDQDGKKFLFQILKEENWFFIFILRMIHRAVPMRPATCVTTIACYEKKGLK